VICGQQLTEPIALKVGIKTGCPWSAVNFILALNQWMKWIYQCAPLHVKSPNPVQGYADDVQVSSRQEDVIINMLARTDEFLQWVHSRRKNFSRTLQINESNGVFLSYLLLPALHYNEDKRLILTK
ncbi:hypothetical protein JOQ06_009806, partial [Pogonophryne albipinna]